MRTKALALILGMFIFQFIVSCCRDSKYFDFTEMSYELSSTNLGPGEDLKIVLDASDLEFLASHHLADFGFPQTLATSCDQGWGGMKHPFESMEITSTSNFNADYAANENLLSLFKTPKYHPTGNVEYVSIEEPNLEAIQQYNLELLLTEQPTIDNTHAFTITFTKSNGDQVIVDIEEISWQ